LLEAVEASVMLTLAMTVICMTVRVEGTKEILNDVVFIAEYDTVGVLKDPYCLCSSIFLLSVLIFQVFGFGINVRDLIICFYFSRTEQV
jgi:hypothetical protein